MSIFGGKGSIIGVVLAVLAFAGLQNALLLTNFNQEATGIVTGGLLLVSVFVPTAGSVVARRASGSGPGRHARLRDRSRHEDCHAPATTPGPTHRHGSREIPLTDSCVRRRSRRDGPEAGARRRPAAPGGAPSGARRARRQAARPAARRPAASASAALKKGLKVFVIPKNLGNPYFTTADSVKTGGALAALSALGDTGSETSGTAATPASQIPAIQAAISKGANALIVSATDPIGALPDR